MKQGLLVVICLALFITFRCLSIRQGSAQSVADNRPSVPPPAVVEEDPLALLPISRDSETASCYFEALLRHPWIQSQPSVVDLNIEMVRDLVTLEEMCQEIPSELSEEEITRVCMRTLTTLQREIPFKLPQDKYNVLCIPQTIVKGPAPYSIYKRLYLGESEVGMPFYLDVRVFNVDDASADEIIAWHLQTLDGEVVQMGDATYLSKGYRTQETAHGFAKGMRGQYAAFSQVGERLFVLYAEAPLKTFQEYEQIWRQL